MIKNIVFANVLSENGNIYTLEFLEEVVEYFKEKINIYGIYGIRKSFDTRISDITHYIEDLYIQNNILKAKIKIINYSMIPDDFVFSLMKYGKGTNGKFKFYTIDVFDKKYDDFKTYRKKYTRKLKINRIFD